MMEASAHSRGLRGVAPWIALEGFFPGATVFALLLWLSHRFVRGGFGEVRQHAFTPIGQSKTVSAAKRNWWSCTCDGVAGCRCLATIARGLRRCMQLVQPALPQTEAAI